MRKIIIGAFMSLDGVMQAPGGPPEDPTEGFELGGWLPPFWDDSLGDAMDESFSEPFDLLLGRKTYDIFAAHWPFVERDPKASGFDEASARISARFDEITKYVATHRPDTLTWKNSRSLGDDIVATLRDLKRKDGPRLLTQGSTELCHLLLEHDLVDEMRLLVFPLVLGKGKRLFGDASIPATFVLKKSATSSNGAFIATYERVGRPKTGSFMLEKPSAAELERRRNLK